MINSVLLLLAVTASQTHTPSATVNDYSGTVLLGGAMFLPSGQVRVLATGGSGVDGMPYLTR